MLGSFHFYVTLEQLHEKVCKCYYPLCWVLFISTKTKPYLNMELKRYYPLCWVLFISTLTKSNLKKAGKCYYPLCWVLFISTVPLQKPSKIKAFQGHFCKYLSEYSEKRVFQPLFCACQNFRVKSGQYMEQRLGRHFQHKELQV